MKNILRSFLYCCAFAALALSFTACGDDDTEGTADTGISNLNNPLAGKTISAYGETISLSFTASAAWQASLDFSGEEAWATIAAETGNTAAGDGSIRITVQKNKNDDPRTLGVVVQVTGKKSTRLAELTQASGVSDAALSQNLNRQMDEILKKDYLWNTEYSKLSVDFDVDYSDFLYTNLTKMGDTNIEDGGYYRAYTAYEGQRYIYSYIQEIGGSASAAAPKNVPVTRASNTTGIGLGSIMSSRLWDGKPNIGLILGYVFHNSPAEKAGLKRGDAIYEVNGVPLSSANYLDYWNELAYTPQGTYRLKFTRYIRDDKTGQYFMTEGNEVSVTAGTYQYDPVLYSVVMGYPKENPEHFIGYVVLQAFDGSAQDAVEYIISELKNNKITDLVLDLRFNLGGSVAQSRYLTSAIAGRAHDDEVFVNCTYNDGRKEPWTFGSGYSMSPDGLGKAPDLGLRRLFVITSEETASASELVINSLKGIDFPVYIYGSRTRGKNVGMISQVLTASGRRFEFAPIVFRCANAKNWDGYADGFEADYMVNDQDGVYKKPDGTTDDIDTFFPYGLTDWDDTINNASLYWAWCHITGTELPEDLKKAQEESGHVNPTSTQRRLLRQTDEMPLRIEQIPFQIERLPLQPQMGRFGSVIYKDNE